MDKGGKRKDRRMMGRALSLARLNHGLTGDNPSVGCVLLDADEYVVGEGVTAVGGRPHAEEVALAQAGERARGGTAYVTLEPCHGRSNGDPGCSDRLITVGIARVVCAIEDPHPVAKDGLSKLRHAGVRVRLGIKGRDAARLYQGFFSAARGD